MSITVVGTRFITVEKLVEVRVENDVLILKSVNSILKFLEGQVLFLIRVDLEMCPLRIFSGDL
jgi:hypothetical protein